MNRIARASTTAWTNRLAIGIVSSSALVDGVDTGPAGVLQQFNDDKRHFRYPSRMGGDDNDSGCDVDRILKNAKPGDRPIEQVSKYEPVIDLRAAWAPGLTVAQDLSLCADKAGLPA